MQGLRFFRRTSDPYCVNLASFHSPHSLTWRWVLSFIRYKADEARVWPLGWTHRDNGGLRWGFRIPWLGIVSFQQQKPMWFRDLYNRLSDIAAQRDGMLWLHDKHPNKIPNEPPPAARSVSEAPTTLQ